MRRVAELDFHLLLLFQVMARWLPFSQICMRSTFFRILGKFLCRDHAELNRFLDFHLESSMFILYLARPRLRHSLPLPTTTCTSHLQATHHTLDSQPPAKPPRPRCPSKTSSRPASGSSRRICLFG